MPLHFRCRNMNLGHNSLNSKRMKEWQKVNRTHFTRVRSRFSESMMFCREVGLHLRKFCNVANMDCFWCSPTTSGVTDPDIPAPALLTASDIPRHRTNRITLSLPLRPLPQSRSRIRKEGAEIYLQKIHPRCLPCNERSIHH